MSRARPRVAIIYPWLPQYRVEFFERLRQALGAEGVDLDLAHGSNPPFASDRGDEVDLSWAKRLGERKVKLFGRTVVVRERWLPAVEDDLLIVEDALRNSDAYRYLFSRRLHGRKTAFWGPGRTMDKSVGRVERFAKRQLLTRGDWWFAYTAGSAEFLSRQGIPAARISAVGNTLDSDALVKAKDSLTTDQIAQRRSQLGLTEGHSALFIGGLSRTKNLELLVDAGRRIASKDPDFRVVIAGDGPLRSEIDRQAELNPFIKVVGPVFDPHEKALIAAACDVIANPGLVGLVAVDSLMLGIPIVTVGDWPHSPEFEYLVDQRNAVISGGEVESYANSLERLLADDELRARLVSQCLLDAEQHSLDAMVERFVAGVLSALNR